MVSYLARLDSGIPIVNPRDGRPQLSFIKWLSDYRVGIEGSAAAGDVTTSGLTMTTSRLLGRTTAATGAVEEISAGTGLTLTGGALAIGDAELLAIAGLTSAADSLPYFTGSGTASLATLTAFGRSLIDDANAAAAQTTLGLGTMATQAANSVAITGGSVTGLTTLSTATTVVGSLGAASAGKRAMVTDSTVAAAGNFGAVVAGGGANTVPVVADGTNWLIG